MHKRSGVASKPGVQSAQPSRGQGVRCALSASLHKDRAFPTTEQHLRPEEDRMASGLDHSRRTWSLRSKRSRRPPSTSERDRFGLSPRFCPVFRTPPLGLFRHVQRRDRSPVEVGRIGALDKRLWHARTFPTLLFRQFNTSAWPGCDFQLRSLSLFTQRCGALWRV